MGRFSKSISVGDCLTYLGFLSQNFVFLESGPLLDVHMFPLLLDCLEFFFSYLSYFKDDQLSLLCRAIVLVSIALGGDKNGRISFGGNQKKAIFLGSRVDQCISHANF